jgi:thermitase
MRVWLGLMGSILWASMLAQPARPIPVAYDAERDAYYVADELVVGLEPRAPAALASEVMLWVGRVRETVAPLGASVLRLDRATDSDSVRELLLALPGVRYVERNYLVSVCNDPMLSQQWGLARIQASQAWAMASPQRTVYIAIIDTGVDANHPDLSQRMRRYSNGSVYGYNTQLNNANTNDYHGHGTHCAGNRRCARQQRRRDCGRGRRCARADNARQGAERSGLRHDERCSAGHHLGGEQRRTCAEP